MKVSNFFTSEKDKLYVFSEYENHKNIKLSIYHSTLNNFFFNFIYLLKNFNLLNTESFIIKNYKKNNQQAFYEPMQDSSKWPAKIATHNDRGYLYFGIRLIIISDWFHLR